MTASATTSNFTNVQWELLNFFERNVSEFLLET